WLETLSVSKTRSTTASCSGVTERIFRDSPISILLLVWLAGSGWAPVRGGPNVWGDDEFVTDIVYFTVCPAWKRGRRSTRFSLNCPRAVGARASSTAMSPIHERECAMLIEFSGYGASEGHPIHRGLLSQYRRTRAGLQGPP